MTIKAVLYREFFEKTHPEIAVRFPYMKDSFSDEPLPNRRTIVDYLTKAGTIEAVGMDYPKDIFSGERIDGENEVRSDGVYMWAANLAYYVDRYDLQLPQEFVDHILSK